jgi:hypothetical protein
VTSGAPYLVAGGVLLALQRWDDAADAFERYLDFNGSDVGAHTQLARAYAGQGDTAAARKWLWAGLQTWHGLPGAMKRRQLGAYLKAQWARVTLLKDATAIVVAVLLGAGLAAAAVSLYPMISSLWRSDEDDFVARARAAAKACGSQRTGAFAGLYQVETDAGEGASVVIGTDRIQLGPAEYCLSRVIARKPESLHAEAIVRYRAEPGDEDSRELPIENDEQARAFLYDVRIHRGRDRARLRLAPVAQPMAATSLSLRRAQ